VPSPHIPQSSLARIFNNKSRKPLPAPNSFITGAKAPMITSATQISVTLLINIAHVDLLSRQNTIPTRDVVPTSIYIPQRNSYVNKLPPYGIKRSLNKSNSDILPGPTFEVAGQYQ
jgi:hypothetical protein